MTAARSVLRDVRRVTLAALAAGVLAAVVVGVLVGGARLRAWFGLTPERPVGVPVAELWLDNARTLLLAFGAAAAVVWWPRARPLLDVVICVVLGGNVLLVAVALGAYGERLLRLAPGHYVLELLAVGTAAAAYLDARREGALRAPVIAGCASGVAALLLGAALLESAG
jgi:ABC-type amino acid transport system permease subunit